METELKLALPARFAARAVEHPAVERVATGPSATVRLLSIYYDTPKFDLRSAGVGLRLRRGPAGWIQTLKWGGSALGGLHQRGELETPVPAQQLNLEGLSNPDLSAIFSHARVRKQLKPVFVTEFDRASRLLLMGASHVELSLDRGEIVAGTAREPICELELELLGEDAAVLFDLATAMQAQLPLRPLSRSKAQRGYALAGHKETPVKAAAVTLREDMSIAESAVSVLASGLEQLQANEHGMLIGDDPEYLHQMRVAVRRLRSALGAYSDMLPLEPFEMIRAELKWAGARLGVARDWDVFQTELLPPVLRARNDDTGVLALAKSAQELRDSANRTARSAVRSRRYARLILSLGRAIATADWRERAKDCAGPVLPFVTKLLERRYVLVVKRGGKLGKHGPAELHVLRIAIKKLRYALEFFGTLFAGIRPKSFRARVAALQESLGRINDAANMQRLTQLTAMQRSRQLGALIAGWNARVVHEERASLTDLWRSFRRTRRFW